MREIGPDDEEAKSANLVRENIQSLKTLFPELVTEGPRGVSVNVDALKELVGDQTVTDCEEKYGLNWFGKRKARQLALTPSTGTLRPCPDESENWETTENLMIEGDNLEVLKLLQKSYAGKVKLIYIDPPYNTGKDFVYPDNFQDNIKNYLELTGQVEGEQKISSNTEASGRFHTDWLNMMYPRLKLARNLLREDGVIFISIDDTEVSNLRKLCDEIFGEENFIANVVWQKKYSPQNDATYFSDMHDHILVYAKLARSTKNDLQGWKQDLLPRTDSQNAAYKNLDNDPRGPWMSDNLSVKTYAKDYDYPITTPSGRVVNPPQSTCWRVSKERFSELVSDNRIWFGSAGDGVPRLKRFLSEVQDGIVPVTWWTYQECGHNQEAKQELKKLMGENVEVIFDTPKPLKLLNRIFQLSIKSDPNAIVLDFFAGSGTVGHALMEFNVKYEGSRRFILVQLPELIEGSSKTIAQLTKDRLRRAAKKIKEENPDYQKDLGFRVFKLDSSNIRAWDPNPPDIKNALLNHIEHMKPDRSEKDILFELLLKLGLSLTVPIGEKSIAGKVVYSVGSGALFVCLAEKIESHEVESLTLGIVHWKSELSPKVEVQIVFRDSAFSNDTVKTNLTAILEQNGFARNNVRSL